MAAETDGAIPVPRATYRLQFRKEFGFERAAALAPYLARLGVSHVYASPILQARPGSTHGYDIVNHNVLNPEIGSPEDYDCLVAALRERGLGQVLDVVPNHAGVATNDNAWWNDVLENGPASLYADFFDIDWNPVKPELRNKVLLPILGDQYGVVLDRAGQHAPAPGVGRPPPPEQPLDGQVVALGAPAGEQHLRGPGTERLGQPLP